MPLGQCYLRPVSVWLEKLTLRQEVSVDSSKESFREYAKSYKIVLPLLSCYNEMLDETISFLHDSKFILDAGSGPAILAERMPGKAIVCMDYVREMLSERKDKALVGDVQALPFKACAFDAVVALNLIPFVSDYHLCFEEIKKVSRRDALLVISGRKKDCDMSKITQVVQKDLAAYQGDQVYADHVGRVMRWNQMDVENNLKNHFTCEDIKGLMLLHGFKPISNRYIYEGQAYFVVGVGKE